ncbi:FitA-like ribbon-helix-helix domain-containing protein [Nakamurella sp. GG22]
MKAAIPVPDEEQQIRNLVRLEQHFLERGIVGLGDLLAAMVPDPVSTFRAAGEPGLQAQTYGQGSLLANQQHKQQTAAVPKSITIRDIPDETSEELAARAALTGRSLQEYLRARLVTLAQEPDAEVWVARVRARKNTTGSALSVDQILAHRDADRA